MSNDHTQIVLRLTPANITQYPLLIRSLVKRGRRKVHEPGVAESESVKSETVPLEDQHVPYTFGFETRNSRLRHYGAHGHEFGATDPLNYERLADTFLGKPITPNTHPTMHECITQDNDLVRFDEATNEFGVLTAEKVIRTYFMPDPTEHGFASNLDYFHNRCKQ